MKKIFLIIIAIFISMVVYCQDQEKIQSGGFNINNTFVGGGISLGFGSGSFGIGAIPEVGYSVAQFLDAGLVFNLNYNSQKYDLDYDYNYDGRLSSFNYGAGLFARVYPVRFLFLQGQIEQNWISYKDKYYFNDQTVQSTVNATSFLGGVGYAQRIIGQSNFYTLLLFDLMKEQYSPYRDGYNNAIPIIRAGFNIYLNQRGGKPNRGY